MSSAWQRNGVAAAARIASLHRHRIGAAGGGVAASASWRRYQSLCGATQHGGASTCGVISFMSSAWRRNVSSPLFSGNGVFNNGAWRIMAYR